LDRCQVRDILWLIWDQTRMYSIDIATWNRDSSIRVHWDIQNINWIKTSEILSVGFKATCLIIVLRQRDKHFLTQRWSQSSRTVSRKRIYIYTRIHVNACASCTDWWYRLHCALGTRLESIGLIDPRIDFGESIVWSACWQLLLLNTSDWQ